MAFVRTSYGIEYNPNSIDSGESSGFGWVVIALFFIAFASLLCAYFSRRSEAVAVTASEPGRVSVPPGGAVTSSETGGKAVTLPKLKPIKVASPGERPQVVRNLLMRLEEAERIKDIEMASTTIEKIRSLPGQPAADLDDQLARRLGAFNIKRLFGLHNPQWVSEVTVKSGDSAIRIAREHGSSFASLLKLNGLSDANRIRIGQKLKVMENPRFILVVRKRSRIADLALNGRFFKRYDLVGEVTLSTGVYRLGHKTRQFFSENGIIFSPESRRELETLLNASAQITVSEM